MNTRTLPMTVLTCFLFVAAAFAQAPGWIGVTIVDGPDTGVEVRRVEADGPAATAGIRRGDRIIGFDNVRVVGVRQFTRLIAESPVGRTVPVRLLCGGEEMTLDVTAGPRPPQFGLRVPGSIPDVSDLRDRLRSFFPLIHLERDIASLGFRVDRMSGQLREFFGVSSVEGVLVTMVVPDSPASDSGLRAGDVVVAVESRRVASPGEVADQVGRNPESVTLTIVRDRQEQEFRLVMPAVR